MAGLAKAQQRRIALPHSIIVWVMAAAAFAVLPHLSRMPLLLAATLSIIALWRVSSWYRNPHWTLRTFSVLTAVFIIFWLHQGLWGRLPGSQLLCCMLILKSFELNRTRDAMLMVSLSFFVVATWFLFSQSLLTFCYLIAATWLGLTTMIVINRDGCSKKETRSMFVQGARLAIPAVPLALAMFFLFPRLSVPMWGIQGGELEGVTGLSGSMSPGDISNLFVDDGPAFRVTFDAAPPGPAQLYWRGPVLTRFDGKRWTQSIYSRAPARHHPDPERADLSYEVELEPHRQHWLFALDYPAVYPAQSHLSLDYQLRSIKPVSSVKRYTINSDTQFLDNQRSNNTLLRESLQLPDNVGSRARQLVAEWQADNSATPALVRQALQYFRDNPFYYRLDSLPLLNDPIDEFLFESRTGYCEHYASAFTFLMRAAGIPARVVTGYQGGYNNDEYFLVRQSDAHAWSEVWLNDEQGWTRFDPTAWVAPGRVQSGSRSVVDVPNWMHSPWLVDMRNRADKLRHWWNKNIVSFNASRQSRLLQPWGIEKISQQQLLLILLILSIVISLGIFLWYRQAGRILHQDPVVRAYRKMLARFRKAGIASARYAGPLTVMQQAVRFHPELKTTLEALFTSYIQHRYAKPVKDLPAELQDQQVKSLAQRLSHFRLPKKR